MRGSLAALLLLIGAVLTFPAALAAWEQRVLTDEGRFVALGEAILRDAEVQNAIAVRVADDVAAFAEANGAGQVVTPEQARQFTAVVVEGLPGSPLGNVVLRGIHQSVVRVIEGPSAEQQAERDRLRVDLRIVAENVVAAVERFDPTLLDGSELPDGAGQVTVIEESQGREPLRLVRWFHDAAPVIVLLPLAAFVLAFVVSPHRGVTLIVAGVLICLTALARIVLLRVPLESLTTDLFVGGSDRAAARAIYGELANTFIEQDLIVIGAGLVVIVAGFVWASLTHMSG